MRLFISFLFILSISCTSLSRKVANESQSFENYKVCPEKYGLKGECSVFEASIELSDRSENLNSFNFPLPKLDSPYYEEVPYYIKIHSNNVSCESFGDVGLVKPKHFRIRSKTNKERLRCALTNEKNQLEFSYIIPTLTTFPVKEAEWMRGFFPDVVSQTELKLSQIYDKWFEAKRSLGDRFQTLNGVTYRARELLLKYFDNSSYNVISPRKNKFQFERELALGDILVVKDIDGYIFHPKLGSTDEGGFSTEDFIEEGNAGNRYLEPSKIKPFEFFCEQNNKIYDFRLQSKVTFDQPGVVKCGINTKKYFLFPLVKPKGQVEFYVQHMNVEKSIQLIPSQIANASTRIKNKIDQMNSSNMKLFKSLIQRAIYKKESEVQSELNLDAMFASSISIDGVIKRREKLEVCGKLIKADDPEDSRALVELTWVQAYYGYHTRKVFLDKTATVQSQLIFEKDKFRCFPIDAESLLKESYLRSVLFYEP